MLLSIIIPHYNDRDSLKSCLDSLLKINYYNTKTEIIVVDDGSKADLTKIINKYILTKFFKIKFLKLKKNFGPGIARNRGLQTSTGKYIIFLDCDDRLKPNTILVLKKYFLKKPDIVSYNWDLKLGNKLFKSQRKDAKFLKYKKKKLIKKFISMEFNNSVIFSAYRRNLFFKNKIFFKKGIHEDIVIIFKLYFFSKKIINLNDTLYIKINKKNSISRNFSKNHIFFYLLSWKEITKFLLKKYKKIYFEKNFKNEFMSGLRGIIAILVLKNFFWVKQNKNRYFFYKLILHFARMMHHQYINKLSGLNKTSYDDITNSFLNKFFNNNKNYLLKDFLEWENLNLEKLRIYKKKFLTIIRY
jgi:glycosyltransferase involved in cell wall biosynthesis